MDLYDVRTRIFCCRQNRMLIVINWPWLVANTVKFVSLSLQTLQCLGQSSRERHSYFGGTQTFMQHSIRYVEGSPRAETSSVHPAILIEFWFVTDRNRYWDTGWQLIPRKRSITQIKHVDFLLQMIWQVNCTLLFAFKESDSRSL